MKIFLLFIFVLLLSYIPNVILAGECKEHIELHSAGYIAKEYNKNETWVLNNIKINLWQKPTHLGKGKKSAKCFLDRGHSFLKFQKRTIE